MIESTILFYHKTFVTHILIIIPYDSKCFPVLKVLFKLVASKYLLFSIIRICLFNQVINVFLIY